MISRRILRKLIAPTHTRSNSVVDHAQHENFRPGPPFFLSGLVLLFVNSVDGQEISTEPNQSDQTLTQLLDTVWEFELESSPFLATNVGDPRGQDRLSDDSLEAIQSRADQRARFLEKLNAIPAEK